MKLETSPQFNRDLRRIRNPALARRVNRKIEEVEAASSIMDISQISRLTTTRGRHYRIKIGRYRLGVTLEGDTAILDRFGHRSDFYRRFP